MAVDPSSTSHNSPPSSPSQCNPVPTLANLSISEPAGLILEDTQASNASFSNNNLLLSEPMERDDPGVNPEDLPFEDPESVAGESDDGMDNNNGWWETNLDTQDLGVGDIWIDNQHIPLIDQENLIKRLDQIVKDLYHGHGRTQHSSFDEIMLSWVQMMTMSLQLSVGLECGLIKVSLMAATAIGQAKWAAASAQQWICEFWKMGKLPDNVHRKWNHSIIEDKDFKHVLLEHLQCIGQYAGAKDIVPSLQTAQHWMPILGYTWKTERQGQFADGHEQEDVVNYWTNHFIPRWLEFEHCMQTWDAKGNEIPPNLAPGEKEVVVHFHDETIYKAHKQCMTRWIHKAETAGLYKKGEGLSLMLAHMILAKYSFVNMARVVFCPGKEQDGFFTGNDFYVQIKQILDILTEEHPEEHHLLVLNNATTHKKFPIDTPVASKMTWGPSLKVGGNAIRPSGEKIKVNFAPVKFADGLLQELYYPANHPKKELRHTFKGLAKILEEQGVPGAQKLKLQCPTTKGQGGCPKDRKDCCAQTIMANQPDIMAQKTVIEILAESYGCSVLYLPKYHCKLNPIEQVWGAAKHVYRDNPMSSSEANLL